MSIIKEGTKFIVPTLNEFLANGWYDNRKIFTYIATKNPNFHYLIDEKMFAWFNQTLTVKQQSPYSRDLYNAKECPRWCWPVAECLRIRPLDKVPEDSITRKLMTKVILPPYATYYDVVADKKVTIHHEITCDIISPEDITSKNVSIKLPRGQSAVIPREYLLKWGR